MKRALYLLATAVLTVAGFFLGARWGVHSARFQSALAENKLAILNLDSSAELTPQLREFLKARVYHNIQQFYPSDPGYLLPEDWDRGAVKRELLGGLVVSKDPTNEDAWDWQSAVAGKRP